MKRLFLFMVFAVALLCSNAQDTKVALATASATSEQTKDGEVAANAIDGDLTTIWHTAYSGASFPVTFDITLAEVSHVDYVKYIPRQDGNVNGYWNKVEILYCSTTDGSDFASLGVFTLPTSSGNYDFYLPNNGVECGKLRLSIKSGKNGFASAAEVELYKQDNAKREALEQYFEDELFTILKPGVTSADGIEDADVKALVNSILANADAYKKFRVGEYEAYMTTSTIKNKLKISAQYNNYENPTGVYLKAGESCVVAVSGIGDYYVGLKIKNWLLNEKMSTYSLHNGINYITATTEGNVFVDYYTDNFEKAPNVKIHFINAPVQGYWDQETMTNEDWKAMLKGRQSNDSTIIITRSRHAQLAYPVFSWLQHCPTNVDSLMTLYQQTQWALRDILGLERYGRQVKNRQLFYATNYGFMAAGGEGAYCHHNSLGSIMAPDSKAFDFWGVGHEWGHNNQVNPGFKWSGCGETTNNIYAAWAQLHFSGNVSGLRLEDEFSGVGEYSGMRGGRLQTYFEEGIRKGVAWQLQDGPDYHGTTPSSITVEGRDADGNSLGLVNTTSRNYDHFVKLAPFWQLNLWGTKAGKCPDIIPMVIEAIRKDNSYGSKYNTNGKQQINWMKIACDSTGINLLPFFEKAGMLRPINAYIEDYSAGWNVINNEMIQELKNYVSEKGYPAFTEEINYINGHNYHIYRDKLELVVPEKYGEGCTLRGNTVVVYNTRVKNAVAYETYNSVGGLLRITMFGLGAEVTDAGVYRNTVVLYPRGNANELDNAAYIVAVGYDGTRKMIYGEAKEVKGLEAGVYNISSVVDETALSCGVGTTVNKGKISWNVGRLAADCTRKPDQAWQWEAVEGGFLLKNLQTGLYIGGNEGDIIEELVEKEEAAMFKASCINEIEGLYSFNLLNTGAYINASTDLSTSLSSGGATDEDNLWKVVPVTSFNIEVPAMGVVTGCYPFALRLPDGLKACVINKAEKHEYEGKQYDFAFIEDVKGVVPAYTPVVYYGAQGVYSADVLCDDNTPAIENNILHGTTIMERLTRNSFLSALAESSAAGALAVLKTSSTGDVASNKAYLLKNEVGGVTTVHLATEKGVTAIDGVEADGKELVLYDLNGVRVQNVESNRVYVTSDGRKVLVK